MPWAAKDPDSKLDYQIDWLKFLTSIDIVTELDVIDTIVSSVWVDVHTDLTVESDTFDDRVTKVWLSGGVAGTTYELTNRIETAAGRVQDETVELECKER